MSVLGRSCIPGATSSLRQSYQAFFEGSLKSKDKARKGLSWCCSSESQDQVFYKLLK